MAKDSVGSLLGAGGCGEVGSGDVVVVFFFGFVWRLWVHLLGRLSIDNSVASDTIVSEGSCI